MQPKQRKSTRRRSDLALAFSGGVIACTLEWRSESAIADTIVTWAFITGVIFILIYQTVGHLGLKQMQKRT